VRRSVKGDCAYVVRFRTVLMAYQLGNRVRCGNLVVEGEANDLARH
jgi:hypothetical protein